MSHSAAIENQNIESSDIKKKKENVYSLILH
jgi:hypothetical protein